MEKEISLTKGFVTIVNEEDYEWLNQFRWCCTHNISSPQCIYATTCTNNHRILMHRMIMGVAEPTVLIDHKNGNTLDNRRENLRIALPWQNAVNSLPRKDKRWSQYKGVYFKPNYPRPWRARICIDGKRLNLGYFLTEQEAARAYDDAARQYFGEFARLNFLE